MILVVLTRGGEIVTRYETGGTQPRLTHRLNVLEAPADVCWPEAIAWVRDTPPANCRVPPLVAEPQPPCDVA